MKQIRHRLLWNKGGLAMAQNTASNSVLQDYFQIALGTKAAQELITGREAGASGPHQCKTLGSYSTGIYGISSSPKCKYHLDTIGYFVTVKLS